MPSLAIESLLRRVNEDEDKHETVEREVENRGEFKSGKRVGIGKEGVRIGEEGKSRKRKRILRGLIKTVMHRAMMEAEREQVNAQERELEK